MGAGCVEEEGAHPAMVGGGWVAGLFQRDKGPGGVMDRRAGGVGEGEQEDTGRDTTREI